MRTTCPGHGGEWMAKAETEGNVGGKRRETQHCHEHGPNARGRGRTKEPTCEWIRETRAVVDGRTGGSTCSPIGRRVHLRTRPAVRRRNRLDPSRSSVVDVRVSPVLRRRHGRTRTLRRRCCAFGSARERPFVFVSSEVGSHRSRVLGWIDTVPRSHPSDRPRSVRDAPPSAPPNRRFGTSEKPNRTAANPNPDVRIFSHPHSWVVPEQITIRHVVVRVLRVLRGRGRENRRLGACSCRERISKTCAEGVGSGRKRRGVHAGEGNGRSDFLAMSDSEVEDDQLDPALACPICHGVYKNPVSASCCGNSFCKACLEESLMVRDCCPMCRTPLVGSTIDTITPNRALESFIETVRRSGVLQQKNKGGKEGREEKNLLHRVLCRFSTWSVCVRFCNFVGGKRGLEVLRYTRQRFYLPRQSFETIRCLFYVVLVCLVIVFLRVNEQDWASRQKYLAARPASLNMVGESETT